MAFLVTELLMDPEAAWCSSLQEWWCWWSFKYGKRRKKMQTGLDDDTVADLADGLREQLAKEAEERANRGNP